LKVKFKTARESLDNNFFPEELLNEFADYIDWVIEQGPQNTVYADPELKRFFFEEFICGIAKRLRNIKQLPDQVKNIFVTILVPATCKQISAQFGGAFRTGSRKRQL
jgi:hypothetical protein